MEALMLASEVADLLRVSERTVRQWAKDGLLPSVQIVNEVRFSRAAITQVLEKGLHISCSKTYTPTKAPRRKLKDPELMFWEKKPAKAQV